MKKLTLILTLFLATLSAALADDFDLVQGKWTVKKKGESGEYTQTLEFRKNKWTFKLVSEGSTIFAAEGDSEFKNQGPLKIIRLFAIKAGRSDSSLDSVDDERWIVVTANGGQLHLASNFDRLRENEKPGVDTYSKSN